VQFRELKFDRVIFFDCNYKSTLLTKKQIILFVQQVIAKLSLKIISNRNSYKLMLIKNNIIELELSNRLIASNRLIEFESINRLKSWQFESTQLESLDNSISKVEIENRFEKIDLNCQDLVLV